MKTPKVDTNLQSEIFNLFMLSRFAGLNKMYKQAAQDTEKSGGTMSWLEKMAPA